MPAIIASLWGGFLVILRSATAQVLIALGIGFATYQGVDTSIDYLVNMAVQSIQGAGSDVLAVLGPLKVGQCISIIVSAITVRLTFTGMKSGAFKQMVIK